MLEEFVEQTMEEEELRKMRLKIVSLISNHFI